MSVTQTINDARDAAQQAVTAIIHGDRGTAGDIITQHDDPTVLALVLADLTAYVHHRWARAVGASAADGWRHLMTDVEAWRSRQ